MLRNKGLVHIYTGEGKGKTTAGLGLILRSLGYGKKVCLVQFFKSKDFDYGEHLALKGKFSSLRIIRYKDKHPMFEKVKAAEIKRNIKNNFLKAKNLIISKKFDLVVMDEVINAVDAKFISAKDLISLIKNKPEKTELALTGRGNIKPFTKYADYISQVKKIKHPFDKGVMARQAIEY